MRFRKIWGDNCWQLRELSELSRTQGAYFEGDWGVIVLSTMFLVSCSINLSIFHITWLDTLWKAFVYSFQLVFWVPSDIFPEMESLGHKAVPFLIFWCISILLSPWLYQFEFPPIVYKGSLFSTSSPAFVVCWFILLFLNIFYWLWYYSCPIFPPLFPSALHTPSHPHSLPLVHVHGSYI